MIILRRLSPTNIKLFYLFTIMLALFSFLSYLLVEVFFFSKSKAKVSVNLSYVAVHLDFKGAPPKMWYLESILLTLKESGANALVMEYEDMFPYEGKLTNLSSKNCYERTELERFLRLAVGYNFEIIPLVQTFGHMEHALKLREFSHLREDVGHPDSICPSRTESRALVYQMLKQVIDFHNTIKPIKFIHIGCDEVYKLNLCEHCVKRKLSDVEIFTQFVQKTVETVSLLSPGTAVLIWDDMLRGKHQAIEETHLAVQPVYWDYTAELSSLSDINLYRYHRNFDSIWIASAYKGAEQKVSILPNIRNRMNNNFGWMSHIVGYTFGGENVPFQFKGIILTGWSRFSHMSPLCELLPPSMPSLILNLLLIKVFNKGIYSNDADEKNLDTLFSNYIKEQIKIILKCDDIDDIDYISGKNCRFDGHNLYENLEQYTKLYKLIEEFYGSNQHFSYLEYYYKKGMVSTTSNDELNNLVLAYMNELNYIEKSIAVSMAKYYTDDVVQEYVKSKTYKAVTELNHTLLMMKEYKKKFVWDRTPSFFP